MTWTLFKDQFPKEGQKICWEDKAGFGVAIFTDKDFCWNELTRWIPYPAEPEPDEVTLTMTLRRLTERTECTDRLEFFVSGLAGLARGGTRTDADAPAYVPLHSLSLPEDAPVWAVSAVKKVKEYYK